MFLEFLHVYPISRIKITIKCYVPAMRILTNYGEFDRVFFHFSSGVSGHENYKGWVPWLGVGWLFREGCRSYGTLK